MHHRVAVGSVRHTQHHPRHKIRHGKQILIDAVVFSESLDVVRPVWLLPFCFYFVQGYSNWKQKRLHQIHAPHERCGVTVKCYFMIKLQNWFLHSLTEHDKGQSHSQSRSRSVLSSSGLLLFSIIIFFLSLTSVFLERRWYGRPMLTGLTAAQTPLTQNRDGYIQVPICVRVMFCFFMFVYLPSSCPLSVSYRSSTTPPSGRPPPLLSHSACNCDISPKSPADYSWCLH